jgi:hypothetical protein|tara:strand:+ start:1678 stop:1950 length:273 start_codon:yes stop_codon:yes gene_type:complete
MEDLGAMINQFGFPIIAAFGLGYFIYYIWTWVTESVDPVIHESHMTLIGLIDRIRMLDNDLIRLKQKLDMIELYQDKEADRRSKLIRTRK